MSHGYGVIVNTDMMWKSSYPLPQAKDLRINMPTSEWFDGVTIEINDVFRVTLTPEQAIEMGKELMIVGGYLDVFKARFGESDGEHSRRLMDERVATPCKESNK